MASENVAQKRKEDALELAYLLYDIFKESQIDDSDNAKIEDGQNHANQNKEPV